MIAERSEEKSRKRSHIVLLVAAACLISAARNGMAAPPPKVSGNLAVNAPQELFPQGNPTRITSSIAASADGTHLLAVYEDLQGFCGTLGGLACTPLVPPGMTTYSFSTDGGATWTDGGTLEPIGSNITAGHPWVDRLTGGDAQGRDAYLVVNRMQDGTAGTSTGLGVYRGHFSGNSFVFDDAQLLAGADQTTTEDSRPEIAAAKDGSGTAYISYVNVDEICDVPFAGFGEINVWNTHDAGRTWNGPTLVSADTAVITDPNNPRCGDRGYLQTAPDVAIGPQGEVYVAWQYGPQFYPDGSNGPYGGHGFASSSDGGKTFTAPVVIEHLNAMRDDPPVGYAKNRLNDQPRITAAVSGPYRGRIYVTSYSALVPTITRIADQSLVSSQARILYSDDRGVTWTQPAAITAPVPATGVKQIWPVPTVRPDGAVDIVYLESQETDTGTPCSVSTGLTPNRTGPASSLVDTFWVESRDGGATFSAPLRVSTETSNWCTAPFMFDPNILGDSLLVSNAGDYFGSTSIANRTLTVWPDDRNGPMDTFVGAITGEVAGPHQTHQPGDANP